jgi:AcrR family transcriptional regulator
MKSSDTSDGRSVRAVAKRQKRRQEILTEALKVFSKQGYHSTSITDIVEAAGIARGTFYQYFDSKKMIFLELLNVLIEELRGSIVGVAQHEGAAPLETQLIDTVYRIFTVVDSNRSITSIVFREAVGLDDDIDTRLNDFYTGLYGYIMAALQIGQQMGAVRALDQEVVANCIVGSMRQVAYHYLVVHPTRPFHVQRIAREVVLLHLHGVLASR